MFLFFLLICFLIFCEYKRTKILFSFYNIFLLYASLYTTGIYFSGEKINYLHSFATQLMLLSIFGFVIGYNLLTFLKGKRYKQSKTHTHYSLPNRMIYLVLGMFIFAIILFFYVVIIKIGFNEYFFTSRALRSLLVRPYSHMMFFIGFLNVATALSLFIYLETKNKKALILHIYIFSFSLLHAILTVSRNNLVLLLFPVIYLYHYYDYFKSKAIVIVLSLGLFVSVFWKQFLYSLIFNNQYAFDLNFKLPVEFYTWQHIAQNVLSNDIRINGQSYIDALLSLIYPFHDVNNLSLWYVKKFESDVYYYGGGRGFSNVLEAYMNFGVLGVFIFFLILGFFIYKLQLKSQQNIVLFFAYIFSFAFIHRIFRSDFLSLTKTWWWTYFILSAIIFYIIRPKKI